MIVVDDVVAVSDRESSRLMAFLCSVTRVLAVVL